MVLKNTAVGGDIEFHLDNGAGSAVNFVTMESGSGNVGIGTSTPTQKLDVVGNGNFSGTVTASCGTLVCSDKRYKKNVQPIQNALANVMGIQGVNYYFKTEEYAEKGFNNNQQVGVIAQEIEQIIPEVVATDNNGFKSVDYAKLTPVLIEAIKEQQHIIQTQKESLEEHLKLIKKLLKQNYYSNMLEKEFDQRIDKLEAVLDESSEK